MSATGRWNRTEPAARHMPSAAAYDRVATLTIAGFYRRVADEMSRLAPGGAILDIGCGPGRVTIDIARRATSATVTGIDVLPDMVDWASAFADRTGLAGRVTFQLGDVSALPFTDASFDAVVSTLSLHHWPDPSLGLSEVHRVLKPGGEARIYDPAGWIQRTEGLDVRLADLVAASPFSGGVVSRFWAIGPVPLIMRASLRRLPEGQTGAEEARHRLAEGPDPDQKNG